MCGAKNYVYTLVWFLIYIRGDLSRVANFSLTQGVYYMKDIAKSSYHGAGGYIRATWHPHTGPHRNFRHRSWPREICYSRPRHGKAYGSANTIMRP